MTLYFDNAAMSALLDPKSIAVVGASPKTGSFGGTVVENLIAHFDGEIYPVNPRYELIKGKKCYPDLAALPVTVDCVAIAVPADKVEGVVLEAVRRHIKSAIVFSSGFSEIGTEQGRDMQQRLHDIAKTHGIRILGPNCTGVVNVRSGASCNILPSIKQLPMVLGEVGLVGQSGALGYVIFQAMHRGVGFSHLISTGNSCDVDIADLINFLVDDPQTKAIATIFESVPDGKRLQAALQRAFEVGKPVVAYKIGTTSSGQKAALSHSGMLAGDAHVYDAMFRRTGVVQVHSFEALLETSVFFSRAGLPDSTGVGVISGSGGSVVMAADKADHYQLDLPQPTDEVTEQLAQRLPSFAAIHNPADITAESIRDEGLYEECVSIFARDPHYAGCVILMPSAHGEAAIKRAEGLSLLAAQIDKPIALVWMNEWYEGIGSRVYDESTSLSVFRSLDRCMNAFALWFDYGQRRKNMLCTPSVKTSTQRKQQAEAFINTFGAGTSLTESDAKKLFRFYDIPCVEDVLCQSKEQAIAAAERIGYPVVAKVQAASIMHKSDIGGVQLDLKSAHEVAQAYEDILDKVTRQLNPTDLEGISIQKMVLQGVEMLAGVHLDPQFGPVVVFGFGGTLVEVLREVVVGLAPITPAEVYAGLQTLRLWPVLLGVRGQAPCDIDAFVEVVVRLSELAFELQEQISEIDINPIVLHEKGAIAVDGLVVRR